MTRVLLALLLVACTKKGPTDAGTFADQYKIAFSQRAADCFRIPLQFSENYFFAEDYRARVANASKKDRVGYDGRLAVECLEALPKVSCEDFLHNKLGACDKVLPGKIKVGGTCYETSFSECETGYACDLSTDCEGICRKVAKLGSQCDASIRCDDGLECSRGLCRPLSKEGQPCGGTEGTSCDPTLFCEQTSPTAVGTCRALVTEGACDTGVNCAIGYTCMASDDTLATFVCDLARQEGESCILGRQQCTFGTTCTKNDDGSSTCTGPHTDGELCGVKDREFIRCEKGFCDGDTTTSPGTCAAPLPEGEACGSDAYCQSGLCDIFATGKCIAACPLP